MTMTRQGCERETKFRVSKHVEGKVTLFCPSTSNRSPSCEVPYSDDNLYDEIISEITIRRFTDSLKTMDNGESEVKFETVLNQRAPNFTNDPELLSSLLKKNEALLKENTDYKSVIKRQTSQIKLLESKLKMIHADMREDNIGSIDQKNIERLQRRCEELQEQIFEMKEFFQDHGLMWIGRQSTDHVTSPRNETGLKLNETTLGRLIQQIHLLSNWNNDAHNEKEFISQSNSSNIVCLQNQSPIPLTLYADGLCFNSGPFRPYKNHDTLQFVQDILDGYFPSELQSSYPNGVQFKLIDKHTTHFMLLKEPTSFSSCGYKLGSSLTSEQDADQEVFFSDEEHLSNIDKNEEFSIRQVENQTKVECKMFNKLTSNTLSTDGRTKSLTFDELLKRLPEYKLTRSGQLLNIRNDIKSEFGEQIDIPSTRIIKKDYIFKNNTIDKNRLESELITLRIYSENGLQIYNVEMHPKDTIGELYTTLDHARSTTLSKPNRNYCLVAMGLFNTIENPNELCNHQMLIDLSATLAASGIVDRTTLRMELIPQELTKNQSQFDVNNALSDQRLNLWSQDESVT
uniref:UBX domain-containing protein 11 n=1 Tax=Schistosoma mansoni TaxID=6183 RepID=A0A3Q0KP67_SCHMA